MAKTPSTSKKFTNLPFGLDRLPRRTVRAMLFVMTFATVGVWVLLFTLAASHDLAAETNLHNLQNQQRSNVGVGQVIRSRCVTDAAREWAAYMADNNFKTDIFHTTQTQRNDLIKKYCGTTNAVASENIAWASPGWGSGEALGKAHFDSYMGSSGHKANIERAEHQLAGVGLMVNPSTGDSYSAVMFVRCMNGQTQVACGSPLTDPVGGGGGGSGSNPAPEGSIYTNDDDGAGYACQYQSGWAIDQSDKSQPIAIHVYINGTQDNAADGTLLQGISANNRQGDANFRNIYGTDDVHGWTWNIPDSLKDGRPHNVEFFVIDYPTNSTGNHSIGVRTINCGTPAPPQDRTPPSDPGSFRVNGAASTALRVAWTASSDDIGVSNYSLRISGGGKNETRTLSASTTTYIWNGLASDTPYTFTLIANDASGKHSNAVTASYRTYPSSTATNTIVGVGSNKCLDVRDGRDANYTVIQILTCSSNNPNQQWILKQYSDSSYEIRSNIGSKSRCLDLPNGQANDGQDLWLYDCNASVAQKWYISDSKICSSIIHSSTNTRTKCLDVEGPSSADKAVVQVWEYYGQSNQQWRVPK